MRRWHIALLGLLAAAALAPLATAGARAPGGCGTVRLPVALTPAGPAGQAVAAVYCTPGSPARAVDILVPGATYTDDYWLGPGWTSQYSYADRAVSAGQAVLAYDRPGTGGSTRPPATALTMREAPRGLSSLNQAGPSSLSEYPWG